jgi:hypothetical protein
MKARILIAILASALPITALAQGTPPQATGPDGGAPGISASRPANLCKELAAFLHPPARETDTSTPPTQAATAVQAPSQDKPTPKPGDSGAPQKESGQSGPIPSHGPGAAGPQGSTQTNAQAAKPDKPAAPAAAGAPKPAPEAVARAEEAAASNDVVACRAVAQGMRRAGVAMPAPLIALAAMDPKLLEAGREH